MNYTVDKEILEMTNNEIMNQVNSSNDVTTTVKTYILRAQCVEATAEVKSSGDVKVVFNGQSMWYKSEDEFKANMSAGCELEEV